MILLHQNIRHHQPRDMTNCFVRISLNHVRFMATGMRASVRLVDRTKLTAHRAAIALVCK